MGETFLPTSRYFGLATRTLAGADEVPYLARRIIPERGRFTAFGHVTLSGTERIDAIAAEAMGDPLLYWRICDADGTADPAQATVETGKRLMLPLPLEISGNGNA